MSGTQIIFLMVVCMLAAIGTVILVRLAAKRIRSKSGSAIEPGVAKPSESLADAMQKDILEGKESAEQKP